MRRHSASLRFTAYDLSMVRTSSNRQSWDGRPSFKISRRLFFLCPSLSNLANPLCESPVATVEHQFERARFEIESGRTGREGHCDAIHAITQARGRRPIVENMSQVATASTAMNCRARHAEGAIFGGTHGVIEGRPEAGPTRVAFELCFRRIDRQLAAGAREYACPMLVVERAGKGPFGSFLPQHCVLFRRQQFFPFRIRMGDFEFLGSGRRRCWPVLPGRQDRQPSGTRHQEVSAFHHCVSFSKIDGFYDPMRPIYVQTGYVDAPPTLQPG